MFGVGYYMKTMMSDAEYRIKHVLVMYKCMHTALALQQSFDGRPAYTSRLGIEGRGSKEPPCSLFGPL